MRKVFAVFGIFRWFVCVALLAFAFGNHNDAVAQQKRGGVLKLAFERDVENLEPQRNVGATTPLFQGHIYEPLIGYGPKGELEGRLAEKWENPDPLTWVFHLRHGVKFHSGANFTSQDVIYSFQRLFKPETAATRAAALSIIKSVEAPDDYTIVFKLSEPYGVLPVTLSLPDVAMLQKGWSEAGHNYNTETNGTGPFKLASYERNVRYRLVRHESYWRSGIPYLDGVDILSIPDVATRVNALLSGEIDFGALVPWQRIADVKANPNFGITLSYDSFMLLRLNPSKPPFNDVRLRLAVNYAINRDAISTLAFGGQAQPVTAGLIRPDSTWFNPAVPRWKYDPERARKLLAEANLKPSDIKFTLFSITAAHHIATAEVVVQQLKEFGMDVALQTIETATLFQKRGNGEYQAMMDGGSNPIADPDFYSLWFASSGGSFAKAVGFSVPELDAILSKARNEPDGATRKDMIWKAEQIILDNAPIGFLVFRPQADAYAKKVKDFAMVPGFGSDSPLYLKMDRVWLDR